MNGEIWGGVVEVSLIKRDQKIQLPLGLGREKPRLMGKSGIPY